MLQTETLRSDYDARRIQIAVKTDAATSHDGKPVLLGWIEEDTLARETFYFTLCNVWLENAVCQCQPCASYADGLRMFIAVEKLIATHGLDKASQMLQSCQRLQKAA